MPPARRGLDPRRAARPTPQALARIGAGVGLGASLSAFQWLSALAEKRFVHIDSPLGILFFDYREHFLAAWQWLSPLWGYHGSFAGTRDDMAFQIGPVHAAALAAAVLLWAGFPRGAPGDSPGSARRRRGSPSCSPSRSRARSGRRSGR